MAAFDWTKQQKSQLPPNSIIEHGSGVTIAGVSGQDFTVATKMKKVRAGFGMMDTDGILAKATVGNVSNGQVTFTRLGPISTSADTFTYALFGVF